MGFIYVITNKITGLKYIGQTSKTIEKRLLQHFQEARGKRQGSRYLNHAINKYGPNNFEISLVEENNNDSLDDLERKYIKELNTLAPNGYNIQIGGQSKGRKHCELSCELMRQKKLGENNHNYGKPRTDEAKHNISLAKSGEKHHFYGKTFNEDHKLKLSASHKKYQKDLPMYIGYIKPREGSHGSNEGYVVINPITKKKKYFTSKKLTMQDKLNEAKALLANILNIDMVSVQRLDGDGSCVNKA